MLLLTGAASGLGVSIAGAFAASGHEVLGLARSERAAGALAQSVAQVGGSYVHLRCDVTQPGELAAALRPYADRIDVVVHNAHLLLMKSASETSGEEFEQIWRAACLGAFLVSRAVLPFMTNRGAGTLIFTGATASLRGAARFAAFASAKFALRGLAQSLAREYGPQGVHVAHVVLDGLVDEPQTDARFGASASARIDPEAVARSYLELSLQHSSAWTQELDLRPAGERY